MCFKKKSDGKLVVNLSGEKVPLELKLKIDVWELIERKQIRLDVVVEDIPIGYEIGCEFEEPDKDNQ